MGWNLVDCEMDEGPASRAAIGLIALASDTVSEPEISFFLPSDRVALYASRVSMSGIATVESLMEMKNSLKAAAELLVPDDNLDVIAYGCTAGAILIGSEHIAQMIREARQADIAYSDPILAGFAALRTLNCQQIALLTPYIDSVGDVVADYFTANGIEIVTKASFKKSGDPEIARISPSSIYKAAVELGNNDNIHGIFISCTALRVSEVIEAIEQDIQKPVVSSNQALAWHCLRLAGYKDSLGGRGILFST
jgi:maleate isomerase